MKEPAGHCHFNLASDRPLSTGEPITGPELVNREDSTRGRTGDTEVVLFARKDHL